MDLRVVADLPCRVREIRHVWIPMPDGCRLAARVWLPENAMEQPVPAILEYIPYRKNDDTAARDAIQHPYVAGHGYATVRVDIRGSGDSEGILYDEYLPQELEDGAAVIAWLAAQPWCSGAVGIIGKSWGGFNGLQIAALRPPALKAVITVCSTDDRYADDVHYVGGCLLAASALPWASTMLAYNARPPDPAVLGERWREVWLDRMERTLPFIHAWLSHQRRDAFWQHGSVCEDFGAITCPVYAVGGWADGYTNAIPRLLEGLPGPRKGLIGPWSHNYPQQGVPGPAIGFLQECLRWWDYWLKGMETGIMDEPMLRVWMQEARPPQPFYAERPGRWVAEPVWPSPRATMQRYALGEYTLDAAPAPETRLEVRGSQLTGLDAGTFCPYGNPSDLPPDQRSEDGLSLAFTSAPLDSAVEVLGFPELTLTLAVDRPNALIAARLCDVAPSGASTLLSRGLLNLTHRESHEQPTPLEPGRRYTVTVRLSVLGHRMPAGHCWRVAISPTYWPWAWPSPEPVTLSLFSGAGSALELPLRPPRAEDEALAPFGPPEGTPPLQLQPLRSSSRARTVTRDVATGRCMLTVDRTSGGYRMPDGLEYDDVAQTTSTIVEGDPLSAQVRCTSSISIGRADWRTRVETVSAMTADATTFHVTNVLDAYEGNVRVFGKTWTFSVPRDLC